MSDKIVYLMRGLPSCGKSHTAKILAGETGVICETDEYFYTQVGEDPTQFDYQDDLLETARQWNFERFCRAVEEGRSPIVVDRGNSLSLESQQYAHYAADRGYHVELREPERTACRDHRGDDRCRIVRHQALVRVASAAGGPLGDIDGAVGDPLQVAVQLEHRAEQTQIGPDRTPQFGARFRSKAP